MSYPLLSNDISTTESNTQRNNFYIHGRESYGDNGGIDLSKEDTRFFRVLESLKQEYKEVLESLKDNNGKIVVMLEVGYNQISIEVARLKAFMYALRYGEGTFGEKGYKTIVGGGTFDNFSKHPQKSILIKYFDTNKNEYTTIYSTAAGAYQFLSRTWSSIVSQYGKRYNINDFSPKNQDKACIILIKYDCKALSEISNENIKEAVKKCKKIWASLPYSPYGQRTEKIDKFLENYNKHLKEELQGISNLALSNEEVAEFFK